MGRRKERRMAAISAAGRRVKLDLSVEPTGDVTCSSLHTEVGGDLDQEQTGSPSSPSSGQKQGNPLLLLGQYSDEEVDENTNKEEKIALEEASSMHNHKAEENVEHYGNITNSDKHAVSSNGNIEFTEVGEKNNDDGKDLQETNIDNGVDPYNEVPSTTGTCDIGASAAQIIGDASGGWKLVMHEESNRHYYWNTLTGETSWEIPDVLAQAEGTSSQHLSSLLPGQSLPYVDNGAADTGNVGLISGNMPVYMIGSSAGSQNSDAVNMIYNSSQTLQNYGISGTDFSITQAVGGGDKPLTFESHEETDVHSAPLIMHCEILLKKLKEIERSELALKCIFEVETRLADCKVLSSFGSSILPFWSHVKSRLIELESIIEKDILGTIKPEHGCIVDHKDSSSPAQGGSDVAQIGNGALSLSQHFHSCDANNAKENEKEGTQLPVKPSIENEHLQPGSSCQLSDCGSKVVNSEDTLPSHFIATVDSGGAGEDVDMDVEMEVDEEMPVVDQATRDSSSPKCSVPQEGLVQPALLSEAPLPLEGSSVPPPPDEEWIPPPPPDAESQPPLPPDEPPSVPPPPYSDSVHSFPYVDQYNMGYSVPNTNFQYYAPMADGAQGVGYYVDGTHVAETQPVQCYESTSYSDVAAVVSVEPMVYYEPACPQNATIHGATAVASSNPSFQGETGPISHTVYASSDHSESSGILSKTGNIGLPLQNVESEYSSAVNKVGKINVLSDNHSIVSQGKESVHLKGNDVDVASTIATKNSSKVARGKKRAVAVAPTFRSNKKVSSLVDKWKAAKEELHEDEEDEDDAYEILEKKRQKEIEEWHARQIASGEAQDNANFLPLGGDWRERVKRRRAETSAVLDHASEEDTTEKKPDLVELSKGLPSGWQVYWDESSKKVYYGNLNTSETTWTRPSS